MLHLCIALLCNCHDFVTSLDTKQHVTHVQWCDRVRLVNEYDKGREGLREKISTLSVSCGDVIGTVDITQDLYVATVHSKPHGMTDSEAQSVLVATANDAMRAHRYILKKARDRAIARR